MNQRSTTLASVASGDQKAPEKTIFDLLDNPRFKSGIAAVAGKFITADRMLRLTVNAIKKTPRLMECSSQSLLGAVMTTAALGLEPNTLQQQAFLIPYKGRAQRGGKWVDVYDVQFQVGARGFITLADRAGIRMVADAIHEEDLFENEIGSESFLRYRKFLRGDRGALIAAFSYARFETGETSTVLPLDELMKIRARSETYRALVAKVEGAQSDADRAKESRKLAETPWVMWTDDMAAKSAIKKHAKQLPIAANDLQVAAELDNAADANVIDMAEMVDPDMVRAVVRDGMAPPALENEPSETLDTMTGEIYGVRETVASNRETEAGPGETKPAASLPTAAEPAQVRAGPPAGITFTFAQVQDNINRATTLEALDEAAALISACTGGKKQQTELTDAYKARRIELGGAA